VKASKLPYILTTIGIILAALLVYSFVYTPRINAAKALDQERQTVAEEAAALERRADLVAAKVKDLPAVGDRVAEFSQAVPTAPAQRELLAAILEAGASSGVKVTGINPAAPTPTEEPGATAAAPAAPVDPANAGPLYQAGLTINATGDPQNLLVFMQKVESLKRPFTTTEVTIAKADGTGSNLTLTGNSFMASPLSEPQVPAEAAAGDAEPDSENRG
jgi:Tfp pilus assembly protein PilO